MIEVTKIDKQSEVPVVIAEIKNAQWAPRSEIDPSDYTVEDLASYIDTQDAIFCVAFFDNSFAGMASVRILPKPDGDKWLYIDEVDVCEDQQRKGVGKELMRYLLQLAKEKECTEVWLGTELDNVAANALYKSVGPDEVEEFVGYTYKV